VSIVVLHHENRAGQISGAWEGVPDLLVHVQAQGNGRTRLHWQKARWSSSLHGTTSVLAWGDGESFELQERPELDDDTLAGLILEHVRRNPGTGWTKVEEATPGRNRQDRMAVRDRLLASGLLVNVAKIDGADTVLHHLLERKPSRLFVADDPTLGHLLPTSGADGEQVAPAMDAALQLHLLPAPSPMREQGVGAAASASNGYPDDAEVERLEHIHGDKT
jgi:hypothetical protein